VEVWRCGVVKRLRELVLSVSGVGDGASNAGWDRSGVSSLHRAWSVLLHRPRLGPSGVSRRDDGGIVRCEIRIVLEMSEVLLLENLS
jgi:hypothetical protein